MSTPYKSFPFVSSIISPPPSPKKYQILLPPLKFPFEYRNDDSTSLESQQSRYRMRLLDAPTDLLDYIEKSNSTIPTPPSHCLSRFSLSNAKSSPLELNHAVPPLTLGSSYPITMPINQDKNNDHKISVGRNRNTRKNPYPIRAPTMSSPGITFKVDMYTPVLRDPLAILRSNEKLKSISTPQRKRKGNSLARVMADRGLLESVFNADITSNDIKSVRIPPPPSMQFDDLMNNINKLNLDTNMLEKMSPEITWKGQPLSIAHLPHYDALHPTEAHVVSVLRLTPVQYLTGKHTLVSAAQRYSQRALPFRKSDAQKLLRIDVNKASKLWEFFQQVKWI
ncbi:6552_t:CDS:2 [Scutellospora calospora]|uniref:6552_t:CDS:1 n=1 Tax=Scutellospora calospora TaxID=85575 RepID=A0ACA9LHD7_9GLOM|nr:6552_t:CDS:2 [Scutellospora calospora]